MKTKRFLACFAALVLLLVSLPLSSLATTYARVISNDVLHLRDYPGTSGNIIGRYRNGTRVEVLYTGFRYWARVKTPDGKVGYMYKAYLSTYTTTGTSSSSSSSGTVKNTTQYIRSGIGLVNFRKNASVNSKLLDQLEGGTRVTVLSQGTTWSRIKYNNTYGWVKTKYLTTKRGQ